MMQVNNKILIVVLIISSLFYDGQNRVSFEDIKIYNNGKEEEVLYNNEKFSGQYFRIYDTLKTTTTVFNGVVKNIEEIGPNHKVLYDVHKDKLMYKKLYNSDSKLISEGMLYDDNYKDGEWKNYYSNGSLRRKEYYKKGTKKGIWKYYNLSGNILKIVNFKNEIPFPKSDQMNKNIIPLESLSLKYENCKQDLGYISFDKHNCDFFYYKDNLKYIGYAVSTDGNIFFIDDGKAIFVKTLTNGEVSNFFEVNDKLEKNGDYFEFFPSGENKIRGSYKIGHKNGDWLEYYNTGILKSKKKFYDDIPKEWWFYYSENGNKSKIEIYSNGKLYLIGKPTYLYPKSKDYDYEINTKFYNADTGKFDREETRRYYKKTSVLIE